MASSAYQRVDAPNGCSQNNDTEPSEEETPVETITSISEGDKTQIFFHEYGRHVGGVPRSSLKGKETPHDEGE